MRRTFLLGVMTLVGFLNASLGAGRTAMPFLERSGYARPAAMADAFTAVADDVGALIHNPAGVSAVPKKQLGLTFSQSYEETQMGDAGLVSPGRKWGWGFSLAHFSSGRLSRTTEDSAGAFLADEGTFVFQDTVAGITVGSMAFGWNWGVTAKYLQQDFDGSKHTGSAFDTGLLKKNILPHLGIGASLLNVGSDLADHPLPTTITAGLLFSPWQSLHLSADLRKAVDEKITKLLRLRAESERLDKTRPSGSTAVMVNVEG